MVPRTVLSTFYVLTHDLWILAMARGLDTIFIPLLQLKKRKHSPSTYAAVLLLNLCARL